MRLRLQIWYAAVLLAVVVGFAGTLYMQAASERMRSIDARLESAASYLQATLRGLPPPILDPRGPNDRDGRRPPPGGFREFMRRARETDDGPRPERPDGPGPHRPPGRREPFDRPPAERLEAAMTLPSSLLDGPDSARDEWPYFKIWRAGGSVLAESDNFAALERARESEPGSDRPRVPPSGIASGFPPGFRWQGPDRRENVVAGPHGTTILVGKPVGRELAELRSFAWRLAAGGAVVLAVGLAGGWLISRSITQPIDRIATTASEISARNLARRIETAGLDRELVGLATILNQMFERLEGAFERQSRFTSDASHELRTPLAVLHAHAELALSRPRSAEEYRETLAACLKAAARMGTLVDGLLTLARADAGRLDPQFRTLDLCEVVEEVVRQFQEQAAGAGIELTSDLPRPTPVRGDAALLARVSSNLVANALRYTPRGGQVRVAVTAAGGDGAVLAVEDNGCGIPIEDQSRVFERFFRADKARSRLQGGNGLGLAICKSLVEAHHGSIRFTSIPDEGTRFEVALPLADGSATMDAQSGDSAVGDRN